MHYCISSNREEKCIIIHLKSDNTYSQNSVAGVVAFTSAVQLTDTFFLSNSTQCSRMGKRRSDWDQAQRGSRFFNNIHKFSEIPVFCLYVHFFYSFYSSSLYWLKLVIIFTNVWTQGQDKTWIKKDENEIMEWQICYQWSNFRNKYRATGRTGACTIWHSLTGNMLQQVKQSNHQQYS